MTYGRYSRLDRISDPLARKLVRKARNCCMRGKLVGFYPTRKQLPGVLAQLPEAKYFDWVDEYTRKLFESDIARRLLDGSLTDPDIYDEMPEEARSLLGWNRPRTQLQMVPHLIRYMDWYLGDLKTVSLGYLLNVGFMQWLTIVVYLILFPCLLWWNYAEGRVLSARIGVVVVLVAVLVFALHEPSRVALAGAKYMARAEALELYLTVAYADRPESDELDPAGIGI